MKKVLINIILLFTFSISGMAQIEYGKTVEISIKSDFVALFKTKTARNISGVSFEI